MSELIDRLRYVDEIAPEHCRKSCNDNNLNNCADGADDNMGMGRCYRCTLLRAADRGLREVTTNGHN